MSERLDSDQELPGEVYPGVGKDCGIMTWKLNLVGAPIPFNLIQGSLEDISLGPKSARRDVPPNLEDHGRGKRVRHFKEDTDSDIERQRQQSLWRDMGRDPKRYKRFLKQAGRI